MKILNALKKMDVKSNVEFLNVLIVDVRVSFNMLVNNVTIVEPALFLLTLRFW